MSNEARIARLTAQLKTEVENLALERKVLDKVEKATTAQLYTMLQQALTVAKARIVALETTIATRSIEGVKGLGTELGNSIFLFNKPFKEIKKRNAARDK